MKELVLYHANCADGTGAAAAYQMVVGKENATYVPINYSDAKGRITFAKYLERLGYLIYKFKRVVFLDFCPDLDVLSFLVKGGIEVLVIDHHQTAIETLFPTTATPEHLEVLYTNKFRYVFCMDNRLSGAALTHILSDQLEEIWKHTIFDNGYMTLHFQGKNFESAIRTNLRGLEVAHELNGLYELLRVRDVWDNNNPTVKQEADSLSYYLVHNGLRNLDKFTSFAKQPHQLKWAIKSGELIREVYEKLCADLIDAGFQTEVDVVGIGKVQLLVAAAPANQGSLLGEMWYSRFPNEPALAVAVTYGHKSENVGISLRSNRHFNCRKVAEMLGGGGHDQAAGASLTDTLLNTGEYNMEWDIAARPGPVLQAINKLFVELLLNLNHK